ncbi:MAG: hypothetical protein GC182_10040 [Rhodopseudomonas sp.]|nr:hypothetical protein [Rhodopseudomonas sp.]
MALRHWRPAFSSDYGVAARRYALDVAAAFGLFVATSVAAGRVWRFAFDDELLTRAVAERTASALNFVLFFLNGGDVHPPLAFLGFYGLARLGFADWGLRLCSLGLTGLAFALFHVLSLSLIRQRRVAAPSPSIRLVAVVLFGLCPMAISQGDAIRWYPLFAALTGLAVILYVAAGNRAARLWSAVALGLAASTNFLAVFVGLALMLYRYGLERQFRPRFEAAYWGIAVAFGSLGLVTAFAIAAHRWHMVEVHVFAFGAGYAAAMNLLGLLGGVSVGVGNAWLILPALAIWPLALVAAIDRGRPADPLHLMLAMLAAVPVMALAGFAEPRSFLYLMPAIVTMLTQFIDRQDAAHGPGRAVVIFALLLVTSVGAIANINRTARPFKRNAVVPYRQIIDFIGGNGAGRVLVLSTDPVLVWDLRHDRSQPDRCASYFMQNRRCFDGGVTYDTIFLVSGHSNRSQYARYMQRYAAVVAQMTEGRRKVASMPAGLDEDATLKQWLSGVPLSRFILTVDVYR